MLFYRLVVINKVIIDNTKDWKNRVFGQLKHYKKKRPSSGQQWI